MQLQLHMNEMTDPNRETLGEFSDWKPAVSWWRQEIWRWQPPPNSLCRKNPVYRSCMSNQSSPDCSHFINAKSAHSSGLLWVFLPSENLTRVCLFQHSSTLSTLRVQASLHLFQPPWLDSLFVSLCLYPACSPRQFTQSQATQPTPSPPAWIPPGLKVSFATSQEPGTNP